MDWRETRGEFVAMSEADASALVLVLWPDDDLDDVDLDDGDFDLRPSSLSKLPFCWLLCTKERGILS